MGNELNKFQKEAAYTSSNKVVCIAGAGTGKTHTLISRLKYLTEDLKVEPNSILVLTFTRAGAEEFKSRYVLNTQVKGLPYFGTFHQFCYHLLHTNKDIVSKLGYHIPDDKQFSITVLEDYEEHNLLNDVTINCGLTRISKSFMNPNYKPKKVEKFNYKLFQKQLRKQLIRDNAITYDILCHDICKLFKDKDPAILPIHNKYRYIFVDEFQDTDPIQFDFINSFKTSNIFVIGDIRQAIYKFRGADSSIIKSLITDKKWTVYSLGDNYRSTKQICEFANSILELYVDDIGNVELKSDKEGKDVVVSSDKLLYSISEFNKIYKTLDGTTAVLFKTNREVNWFTEKLDMNNIKYNSKINKNEVLKLLAALDSNYEYDYLLSTLSNQQQYEYYVRRSLFTDKSDVTEHLKSINKKAYDELIDIRNTEYFSELEVEYCVGGIEIDDILKSNNSNTSLYVGTIHSVKGLEFDNVFVGGVRSKSFLLDNEENLNLYYVACTRAKSNLYVYN